jgi:hypothetical protein
MPFSTSDLEQILAVSQGATVIAYSHRKGTLQPNTTILAEKGKAVAEVPDSIFRVGNGCDGPVLEFAVKRRKHNEPVIWVCDGQVTAGADDRPYPHLVSSVKDFVNAKGIIQAENLDEAIEILSNPRKAVKGVRYGRVSY